MTDDSNDRFQLAAAATTRLVSQCVSHAERVSAKLNDRIAAAAGSSPCRLDEARALNGEHLLAFKQLLEHVEAMCNAMVSHLTGLKHLLSDETFHPLPAMVIARAIAEVAASTSWMLHPGLSSDERAARGYATMFAIVQRSIADAQPSDVARMKELREELIKQLAEPGGDLTIERGNKRGVIQEYVAQITIGRGHDKVRAKVAVNYSQRIEQEIPDIGPLYKAMSAVAHGTQTAITTSWSTPDSYARLIGHVASASTEAWSKALHDWVGASAGRFLNETDRQNILLSIPEATRARAIAKFAAMVLSDGGPGTK